MYKVFFNERTVLLTDDFLRNFQAKYGLFYKYRNVAELGEVLYGFRNMRQVDTLYIFHHDIDQLRERFKSCFQVVYAAGGLIHNAKGDYLIMKRRGKWDLPKGKVNKGETMEAAALREVSEETGLFGCKAGIQLLTTYHTYSIDSKPILKRTAWYDMIYEGSDMPVPETEEDITEILWVKKADLKKIVDNTYLAVVDVLKYANLL